MVAKKDDRRNWVHRWVASRHAPPIDLGQGSFSAHAATMAIAAWTDVEEKDKYIA